MTCPICLEESGACAAALVPCGHRFHELCLRAWLERSSSCPTCRVESSFVEVAGPTLQRQAVLPRMFQSPAGLQAIPAAYINAREPVETRDDPREVLRFATCVLCDARGQRLCCCGVCALVFHQLCVGVGGGVWLCPMCDTEQVVRVAARAGPRRGPRSAVLLTDRIYDSLPPVVAAVPPPATLEQQSWDDRAKAMSGEAAAMSARDDDPTPRRFKPPRRRRLQPPEPPVAAAARPLRLPPPRHSFTALVALLRSRQQP